MNDLVTFLKARLDEDESYARAAVQTSARWMPYERGPGGLRGTKPFVGGSEDDAGGVQDRDGNLVASTHGRPYPSNSQVRHIVRHDPARVLREVEAKRRLVEQLETGPEGVGAGAVTDGAVTDGAGSPDHRVPAATLCDAARLLALPYARHPDYQPEWHPA